jgi:transcriptional regulator with XRE-family HTH domain
MPSAIFEKRYASVVDVLASARRDAGVTQVQLAERLGRPQSYVSKIERRERRVDAVEVHDWAVALALKPQHLFEQISQALTQATENGRN